MPGKIKLDGPGLRARTYNIRPDGAGFVNEEGALKFARQCLDKGELRAVELDGFANFTAAWEGAPGKSPHRLRGKWQHWLSIFVARAAGL